MHLAVQHVQRYPNNVLVPNLYPNSSQLCSKLLPNYFRQSAAKNSKEPKELICILRVVLKRRRHIFYVNIFRDIPGYQMNKGAGVVLKNLSHSLWNALYSSFL